VSDRLVGRNDRQALSQAMSGAAKAGTPRQDWTPGYVTFDTMTKYRLTEQIRLQVNINSSID
jgi:hypothetical protein